MISTAEFQSKNSRAPSLPSASRIVSDATFNRYRFAISSLLTISVLVATVARCRLADHFVHITFESTITLAIVWGYFLFMSRFSLVHGKWLKQLILGLTLLTPIVSQIILRSLGGGESNDVLLLLSTLTAGVVLALNSERKHQELSIPISGFVSLFALTLATHWSTWSLVLFYIAFLFSHLMDLYWSLATIVHSTRSANRTTSQRVRVISSWLLLALSVSILIAVVLNRHETRVDRWLSGWAPTSGGDLRGSSFALAGIGDGDAVVAAQDEASSFGPVESELMLDSETPSLYDMLNDLYGDPPKPISQRNRAVALDGPDDLETRQIKAESTQIGREFSTRRTRTEEKKIDSKTIRTAAMFYVDGEVPQHFALERFDTFDGTTWTNTSLRTAKPPFTVDYEGSDPWIRIDGQRASSFHTAPQVHQVKFVNLDTTRVPSPCSLSAVHIDKVDQTYFFGWARDSSLQMEDRDRIPPLTVMHLRSHRLNLDPLRGSDFTNQFVAISSVNAATRSTDNRRFPVVHLAMPSSMPVTAARAESWSKGIPRGWLQVEAIVRNLRKEVKRDDDQNFVTSENTVEAFLKHGSGPAYLFPTAAAMLLRSQGYPTRFVTGFYADDDRFDARTGHTPVLGEDAHAWIEVCVDGTNWIAVEPTPGYDAPLEHRPLIALLKSALNATGNWLLRHPIGVVVGLAILSLSVFFRKRLTLLKHRLLFHLRIARGMHPATAAFHFLEANAKAKKLPRPSQTTIREWYEPELKTLPTLSDELRHHFLSLIERALYEPATINKFRRSNEAELAMCCQVIQTLSGTRRRSAKLKAIT